MTPLRRTLRRSNSGQRTCPVCNEPVLLETCKTDENGQATHEECYVERICSHWKSDEKQSSAKQDSQASRKSRTS